MLAGSTPWTTAGTITAGNPAGRSSGSEATYTSGIPVPARNRASESRGKKDRRANTLRGSGTGCDTIASRTPPESTVKNEGSPFRPFTIGRSRGSRVESSAARASDVTFFHFDVRAASAAACGPPSTDAVISPSEAPRQLVLAQASPNGILSARNHRSSQRAGGYLALVIARQGGGVPPLVEGRDPLPDGRAPEPAVYIWRLGSGSVQDRSEDKESQQKEEEDGQCDVGKRNLALTLKVIESGEDARDRRGDQEQDADGEERLHMEAE